MPNFHPLLVHFPIALLTIYSLLEFARFPKLIRQPWFFYLKASLVILGTGAALLAGLSGAAIEEHLDHAGGEQLHQLVELHSKFAFASGVIFALISVSYLITWVRRENIAPENPALSKASIFLQKAYILVPLALIGLGLLTITSALGGALVYGPDVDPFVRWIYDLIIIG